MSKGTNSNQWIVGQSCDDGMTAPFFSKRQFEYAILRIDVGALRYNFLEVLP